MAFTSLSSRPVLLAPVQSTAGLQVVIGTAPINRASDPYHCTNVPILATSLKEATAALGYDDDYEKYTLCQSMGACFKVLGVSPVVYINVLDPAKHKKTMTETTVQVNSGVATVARQGHSAGQAGGQVRVHGADRWNGLHRSL